MKPRTSRPGPVLPALLFLGFLQLLTDFVAGVYAVGLLQTSVPAEIACVALLFAPVGLLCFREISPRFVLVTGTLMVVSRVVSLVLDTRGRMLAAGIGTAAYLCCFPALLWLRAMRRDFASGPGLAAALALATLLHVLIRALGSGLDVSNFGGGRYLGFALALATGVSLWLWGRHTQPRDDAATQGRRDELRESRTGPGVTRPTELPRGLGAVSTIAVQKRAVEPTGAPASVWRIRGLCVGIVGVLVMLYFGLAAPAVIARWADADGFWVTTLTAGTTALFLALWLNGLGLRARLGPRALLGWNLLFFSVLALTVWSCRVPLPVAASAYPYPQPPVGLSGQIGLVLMLLSSPVLYVNFACLAGALVAAAPSARDLGGGFVLGALWLLLLIFAQVFTTAYDYVPVIGPWFRDRFWLVVLAAGASAVLPVLLARAHPSAAEDLAPEHGSASLRGVAAALALGAVAAVAWTEPRPRPASADPPLRVMTFNLQQGYSASGARNFAGQLELIRRLDPDILGLQETDSARIAGGNADLVRWLANHLNYHAHGGPRTGAGTFGIALLSRFPLERARTFYLHSTGEQTAVLTAEVRWGETTYRLLVTHLGNGGPIGQQRGILELLGRQTNVILMGDFNFHPGTEPYRLTCERLADAWLAAKERRPDPPAQDLARRIDHVFVSPGTAVRRAEYLEAGASDHPVLVVELEGAFDVRFSPEAPLSEPKR